MTLANFVTLSVSRFNPRTPHGVRHLGPVSMSPQIVVSIHAPHTGCDSILSTATRRPCCFNPRTPHGVRLYKVFQTYYKSWFQSTHPTRGATVLCVLTCYTGKSFNPRTPHGVRHKAQAQLLNYIMFQSTHPTRGATSFVFSLATLAKVSIHAPHTGCDWGNGAKTLCRAVSIHAPHTGCDTFAIFLIRHKHCFNPRTPHGVRPLTFIYLFILNVFQSTHPTRGAT